MRRVVIVAFDRVQVLDVTGPAEVFAQCDPEYRLELVAPGGAAVRASNGIALTPDRSLEETRGQIDTLLVAGGQGSRAAADDERLMSWLRLAARRCRRVCSVCTGAFLLARAGLLDGRRATTHWASCSALAREYPSVEVDPDPIFVRDGNVYTSAGVTAGIDLALALVEEDLGRQEALRVARNLVLFIRRPGGQAQFSTGLSSQEAGTPGIRELQGWIVENLAGDLRVEALAERAFMSHRNFARAFKRDVGLTPAAFVESLRLERARTLLETTDLQLDQIAARCGFGTPETLRRVFGRRLHVSPSEYRDRFAGAEVIPIEARRSAS